MTFLHIFLLISSPSLHSPYPKKLKNQQRQQRQQQYHQSSCAHLHGADIQVGICVHGFFIVFLFKFRVGQRFLDPHHPLVLSRVAIANTALMQCVCVWGEGREEVKR